MDRKIQNVIEEYQCSGCVSGSDTTCFEPNSNGGVGCGKHCAGTMAFPAVGKFFLGMPKGFNRLGDSSKLKPIIFENFESGWGYDKFNIPVWKYLKDGHTFVRGMQPRRNETFIHIFLEDCLNKIDCFEVTEADIDEMD
jgi:hypothetical protein